MRGGKRKGAGRKPRSEPRKALTLRVEPEHAAKFRKLCESKGRSQAEQITEWIKRAMIEQPPIPTDGELNGSQHRIVRLFARDGFYAVQNWLSWGSVERIVQIKDGLVMFRKDDWVPVGEYFGTMGEITVVYLESFEAYG